MRTDSAAAQSFQALIRSAPTVDAVDQAIREMWRAYPIGELSEAEASRLSMAAGERRTELRKNATRRAKPLKANRNGSIDGVPRAPLQHTLLLPVGHVKVPRWIGGSSASLTLEDATKAFYLRRELWRLLLNPETRLEHLDRRVASEISFGLNGDPTHGWFGQCWQSLETLAKTLQCRQQSILDSYRRLESFGYVRVFHGRGRGNPNRYEPVIPDAQGTVETAGPLIVESSGPSAAATGIVEPSGGGPAPQSDGSPKMEGALESNPDRGSAVSQIAYELAANVARQAGFARQLDWPPGWLSAPNLLQRFLNEGYAPEIILLACQATLRAKPDGPPRWFRYFEKPIVRMRAQMEAPLPKVVVVEAPPVTIYARRRGNSA